MFKIGQTVWCLFRGKGVVTGIRESTDEVYVCFDISPTHKYTRPYTNDGKYNPDFNRALYFSEPKIIADEVPPFEPTLKKGDKVIVGSLSDTYITLEEVVVEDKDFVETTRNTYYKDAFKFYRLGEQLFKEE